MPTHTYNYPKLHNAAWPGLVGKCPDSEPPTEHWWNKMSEIGGFLRMSIATCAILGWCSIATAGARTSPPDAQAEFERLHQPGPQHAMLGLLAGEWTGDEETAAAPGQAPQHCVTTVRWQALFGGRFVESHSHVVHKDKPADGQSLIGYDNVHKKYTGVWIYDSSTETLELNGVADETGKVITFSFDQPTPHAGAVHTDYVITFVDKNKYYFDTILKAGNEPSYRARRITYTRTK